MLGVAAYRRLTLRAAGGDGTAYAGIGECRSLPPAPGLLGIASWHVSSRRLGGHGFASVDDQPKAADGTGRDHVGADPTWNIDRPNVTDGRVPSPADVAEVPGSVRRGAGTGSAGSAVFLRQLVHRGVTLGVVSAESVGVGASC